DVRFDVALVAVGDFIGLKYTYCLGLGRGVADLAEAAAERLTMSDDEVLAVRRAGLVQGFGRLGVSNSIWDKRGSLGPGEWERVRIPPHLTGHMPAPQPPHSQLPTTATQRDAYPQHSTLLVWPFGHKRRTSVAR